MAAAPPVEDPEHCTPDSLTLLVAPGHNPLPIRLAEPQLIPPDTGSLRSGSKASSAVRVTLPTSDTAEDRCGFGTSATEQASARAEADCRGQATMDSLPTVRASRVGAH